MFFFFKSNLLEYNNSKNKGFKNHFSALFKSVIISATIFYSGDYYNHIVKSTIIILYLLYFSGQYSHKKYFSPQGNIKYSKLAKSITKVMLCVLKIPTKFSAVPQSFFQNQNPVQVEDQDQDHYFTLDFNTRPTFHT